jgi:hypothetical protein
MKLRTIYSFHVSGYQICGYKNVARTWEGLCNIDSPCCFYRYMLCGDGIGTGRPGFCSWRESSTQRVYRLEAPPSLPGALSPQISGRDVKLTTDLYSVSRPGAEENMCSLALLYEGNPVLCHFPRSYILLL